MRFVTDVINAYPDQISDSLPALLSALIQLTQSSLLQGATLGAALQLFAAIVKSPLPNKPSFEDINNRLSAPTYAVGKGQQLLHRRAYVSIAKAVAVVAASSGDMGKASQLLGELKKTLTGDKEG